MTPLVKGAKRSANKPLELKGPPLTHASGLTPAQVSEVFKQYTAAYNMPSAAPDPNGEFTLSPSQFWVSGRGALLISVVGKTSIGSQTIDSPFPPIGATFIVDSFGLQIEIWVNAKKKGLLAVDCSLSYTGVGEIQVYASSVSSDSYSAYIPLQGSHLTFAYPVQPGQQHILMVNQSTQTSISLDYCRVIPSL